ncbi:hypothetical protein BJV82DRAFT_575275 [Fennellomyces sp. T-0311]|nr:hypothetical protein BJV82DRAFT_575275 [Fennellomyces sp. T-0311]
MALHVALQELAQAPHDGPVHTIAQALKTKNLAFKHRLTYVNKFQIRVFGRGRKTLTRTIPAKQRKKQAASSPPIKYEESSSTNSNANELVPVCKGKGRAVVTFPYSKKNAISTRSSVQTWVVHSGMEEENKDKKDWDRGVYAKLWVVRRTPSLKQRKLTDLRAKLLQMQASKSHKTVRPQETIEQHCIQKTIIEASIARNHWVLLGSIQGWLSHQPRLPPYLTP